MGADHQGSQHFTAIRDWTNARTPAEKQLRHASACLRRCQDLSGRQSERALSAAAGLHLRGHEGAARRHGHRPRGVGAADHLRHRSLAAARRAQGRAEGKYRGVAIVDDSVSDAELQRLHSVGVRGARFNFGGNFKLAPSLDDACAARSTASASSAGSSRCLASTTISSRSRRNCARSGCPPSSTTWAGPDYRRGTSAPVIRLMLDLLKNDNWWIGLSNGDLRSQAGYPWDDAVEFGRLFYEAAPDRCLWGTDWPHVHRFIRPGGHDRPRHRSRIRGSSGCWSAMSPTGRRATGSWSTIRRGSSDSTERKSNVSRLSVKPPRCGA